MTTTSLYFAYGSNLSIRRLQKRVPSALLVCTACLPEHQLKLHKRNRDGSSKADCYASGDAVDHIWGALFEIDVNEQELLDEAEGLGAGYERKMVRVHDLNGNRLNAFTYFATDIVKGWLPYEWYLQHVLIGAKEVGLPAEYLTRIHQFEAQADPDRNRTLHELSIYDAPAN